MDISNKYVKGIVFTGLGAAYIFFYYNILKIEGLVGALLLAGAWALVLFGLLTFFYKKKT